MKRNMIVLFLVATLAIPTVLAASTTYFGDDEELVLSAHPTPTTAGWHGISGGRESGGAFLDTDAVDNANCHATASSGTGGSVTLPSYVSDKTTNGAICRFHVEEDQLGMSVAVSMRFPLTWGCDDCTSTWTSALVVDQASVVGDKITVKHGGSTGGTCDAIIQPSCNVDVTVGGP